MSKVKYISLEEASQKWQIIERSARNYCAQGRVEGALLEGKTWKIPSTAQKPDRKPRHSSAEETLLAFLKREKEAGLKGGIYHKIQIDLTYNSNHLESASSILLGSLVMGQKISTLSGGENVRIKILRAWKSSSSVLGIDEPFRGLNKNEICHVANYLTSLLDEKKTIIVIDHEEEGFKYFSNKQELKNIDNVLIGK